MTTVPTGTRARIGNTPLARLDRLPTPRGVRAWGKLEWFNPGGSAKDRSAQAMVDAALASGRIGPGSVLVESSSGNFGVALARLCVRHGMTLHVVVDPRSNRTTVATMRALGATVHELTEPDPDTGDWLTARIAKVAELRERWPDAYSLDQYSNRAALRAHADGTMAEIVRDLGRAPDVVVVATSTTGTIGGCLTHVREQGLDTAVVAVDAEGSVLFGGRRGQRLLSGFGAGIVPGLAEGVVPDDVVRVSDAAAVAGCRLLARTEGMLVGASAGAVVHAMTTLAVGDADVVGIFHDAGLAYLDTVYDDAWVAEHVGALP
ncbi:pyridoxal-phosphate dependent enzyme [Propioniciclava soli]|uniref:Pyridoxal-phosphate dependent enzyme n=1 Tax=Propioniciclava soli TaxID=2775081 RepID=A0ABZ3C624_9ACTN|nr:pyridoxal-phosphate dependent enzyme [Propioniciclava soli]